MQVINSVAEMKARSREWKRAGRKVAFVPTMGYLHRGHLSLIQEARKWGDIVVVSIFVNPLQFGANEDFDRYPRDHERDLAMAREAGVDVVFIPEIQDMYPPGFTTYIEVEGLTRQLCGKSRPGHFRGVATVVAKLFNIVQPDRAYFGLKDAQQVLVVSRMVQDLNMDVEIIPLPTVREPDGLALSSRNVYLSPTQREEALVLVQSLNLAQRMVAEGERDPEIIRRAIIEHISRAPSARIDYVEIRSWPDLEEVKEIRGKVLLALAVFIGQTRLIDNILLEVDGNVSQHV